MEIKFRGKRIDNGEWVYGDLVHGAFDILSRFIEIGIEEYAHYPTEVDHDTVGQYTNLKDKNGKEIYEGDVIDGGMLRCNDGYSIHVSRVTVTFESGMFKAGSVSLCSFNNTSKVIGNIHKVTSC